MIEDTIKKLLALSRSCNEHEAAVAAQKAADLAIKHGINLIELQSSHADYKDNSIFNATKKEIWITNIVSGVALINACQFYIVVGADKSATYRIVGKPHAINVVNLTVDYLTAAVKRLNREHVKQYNLTQTERKEYRIAFRLAASRQLYQRFLTHHHELKTKDDTIPQTNALVVADYFEQEKAKIADFMKDYKLEQKEQSIKIRSGRGLQDGDTAGKSINLGSQLHGTKNHRQIRGNA